MWNIFNNRVSASTVKFLERTTDTNDMSDGGRMGKVSLFSKIRSRVFRRKGQTTLEYVIMAAILILVVMKVKDMMKTAVKTGGDGIQQKMGEVFQDRE